jgi:hypothetical protein
MGIAIDGIDGIDGGFGFPLQLQCSTARQIGFVQRFPCSFSSNAPGIGCTEKGARFAALFQRSDFSCRVELARESASMVLDLSAFERQMLAQ